MACAAPRIRNITLELEAARAARAGQQQRSVAAQRVLTELEGERAAAEELRTLSKGRFEAAKLVLAAHEAAAESARSKVKLLWLKKESVRSDRNARAQALASATRRRASLALRRGKPGPEARLWSRLMRTLRVALERLDLELAELGEELQAAEEAAREACTDASARTLCGLLARARHGPAEKAASLEEPLRAAAERSEREARELARCAEAASDLQARDERGRAAAEQPRLWRRAMLAQGRGDAHAQRNRRVAQLAAGITMDWCVATRSAGAPPRCWDMAAFLESPEVQALRELEEEGRQGEFLLAVAQEGAEEEQGEEEGPARHVLLRTQLLAQLTSPRVTSPPLKLNLFQLLRASLGDSQFHDVWLVPEAPHFHEVALGLDRSRDIAPPGCVRAHLRPYQVAGFQWLAALARNGLGAVLADDMGLGKTLQAIALLAHLHEAELLRDEQGQPRPALVVVPPGLMRNWQQEFSRWAPHLKIYVYHGMQRQLPPNHGADYHVILTTYHMVRNDLRKFINRDVTAFSAMVIDEAQCIKNHGTQMTKAIKEVGNSIGHTRIALSGTPIENKVDELHSIFDFVNFGYLGDHKSFSVKFSRIIEKQRDEERRAAALQLLRRLTHPFQMRRLKTDPNILPDLPEKIDLMDTVELTAEQQRLYSAVQDEWRDRMEASRRDSGNHSFERRGHIFAMLEKVRRICSHPLCLEPAQYPAACRGMQVAMAPRASGKTARLFEVLEEILPSGQKVLVFVTRKAVLRVLKGLISGHFAGAEVLEFSGDLSLQERAAVERRFAEEPKAQVLLITVQCGGIGLNLVAASHVIHFDRCYNPAKEAQATDRCHRMGQRRAVCVHRVVTEGTYEQRLEEIMKRKQDLSSLTITRAEDWIADYDDEALFDLFMLRSSGGASSGGARRASALPPGAVRTPPRRAAQAADGPTPCAPRARPSSSGASSSAGPPEKRARLAAEEEDEVQECSICMDAPGEVKLMPCGHRALCRECSGKVDICPLCRARITQRV